MKNSGFSVKGTSKTLHLLRLRVFRSSLKTKIIIILIVFGLFASVQSYAQSAMAGWGTGLLVVGGGTVLIIAGGTVALIWYLTAADAAETKMTHAFVKMISETELERRQYIIFVFRDGHIESGFISISVLLDSSGNRITGIKVFDVNEQERLLNPDELGFIYSPDTKNSYLKRELMMLREPGFIFEGGFSGIISPISYMDGVETGYFLRGALPLTRNWEIGLNIGLAAAPDPNYLTIITTIRLETRWYPGDYYKGFFLEPSIYCGFVIDSNPDDNWQSGITGKAGYAFEFGSWGFSIAAGWQQAAIIQDLFSDITIDGSVTVTASIRHIFGDLLTPEEYIIRQNKQLDQ